MSTRKTTLSVVLIMTLGSALFLLGAGAEETVKEGPSRAPTEEYVQMSVQSFSTDLFPTAFSEFYLYITSMYNGEDYEDTDPAPGNSTAISAIKLTFAGVYDADMEPVDAVPIEWLVGTIYDDHGKGLTLTSYYDTMSVYADDVNTYMSFKVKKDGIAPGEYSIRVRQDLKTMTGWDGVDKYEFKYTTEYDWIYFKVNSCLSPTSDLTTPLYSWDEYDDNRLFYSGAEYRKVGMKYLQGNYGAVTEIRATMQITEAGFHVDETVAYLPDLSTETRIYWRITAEPDVPPGPHPVKIGISYMFKGVMVNETPIQHILMVQHTPLLLPPDNYDMTAPCAVLTQKDTEGNLVVSFRNGGNVDLKQIRLRLDLQSSFYVKYKEFFYNEENNAYKQQSQVTVDAGDLAVGQSKEVIFPAFKLQQYMPPGKYMIPVDYECLYHDGGETGNPSGDVVAGYWDEKGISVHKVILERTLFPTPEDWQIEPFLFVMVEDDEEGPDIQMVPHSSYTTFTRGHLYKYMYFFIYNLEYYSFDRMTYTVHTDEGSPLLVPDSPNVPNTTNFAPMFRPSLPAANIGGYGSDSLQFYADIKEFANIGKAYVPIDITGYDQYMQPFEKRVYVELLISGRTPKFKVISTSVGNVTDDMTVDVTAVVQNVGGGAAYNITTQYVYYSAGYACLDGVLPLSSEMAPGETATVVFTLGSLAPTYYIRGSFYGYLMFSYLDETGNFYEMSSTSDYFYFQVSANLPNMYISDVRSGLLDWGKTTDVTIKVTNIGGTEAFDVMAYIPQNTNQFSIVDYEIEIGDLAPGETKEFKIRVKAASEFTDGTTYTFYIYFKYRNVENRSLTYSEGEAEYIYLRTKERVGDNQISVIEEKGIDDGTGALCMGFLILIGILAFTYVYAKAKKGASEGTSTMKPGPDPKVRSWEE